MRILFLHLSDIHFEKKDDVIEKHITEIASALSPASIGTIDKIFMLITGDIGFSGKTEQYDCFTVFKNRLINVSDEVINQLAAPTGANRYLLCGWIHVLMPCPPFH